MGFRPPNYGQQRGDRNRIKEQKRRQRLERREEDARKRKAERESLGIGSDAQLPDLPPETSDVPQKA
jgi:hypothetical protein